MKWFLDTEFNEHDERITLISIALVSDQGHEYYAVSNEFDPAKCGDWVKENVLPLLPPQDTWKRRKEIARDIVRLFSRGATNEVWAYFAAYDWVAFCQLFGRLVDVPRPIPQYCMDLKQEMHRRGVNKRQLPKQLGTKHNALEDARWNKRVYDCLWTNQ